MGQTSGKATKVNPSHQAVTFWSLDRFALSEK